MTSPFSNMSVDHVEFSVTDLQAKADWWVDSYGFAVSATSDEDAPARSIGLTHRQVELVLTEAKDFDHPAAGYVRKHGDGVSGIGLGVADAEAAFHEAVRRGARPVSEPTTVDGVTTASIIGFGDVVHTFVHRADGVSPRALPGLRPVEFSGDFEVALDELDHFAVCVAGGHLDEQVDFYRDVLDFEMIFAERIALGNQAMVTKVVESTSGAVTMTLIEPDDSLEPGHISEFLRDHGGAGVQHMAFATRDIVPTLDALKERGIAFLNAPGSYYQLLAERVTPVRYPTEELRKRNILIDEDHDGQLYQIFAGSVHPRNTIFFELIERLGAQGFGSGNITALYEAVELQHRQDQERGPAA